MSIEGRQSRDGEVHHFIQTLENSARRIMRDASRKKKEMAREERGLSLNRERKALIQGEKLKNRKSTTVMMTTVKESTVCMNYSVPKMTVTMGQTVHINTNSNISNNDYASTVNVQLSPIKLNGDKMASDCTNRLTNMHNNTHVSTIPIVESKKRSLVLDKLQRSPFLESSSFESFNHILLKNKTQDTNQGTSILAAAKKETTWSLRLNAASVLNGKKDTSAINKLHFELMKGSKKVSSDHSVELQGPIDYSIHGLKMKYRGEEAREAAFENWMAVNNYSQKVFDTDEQIIPTVNLERHPLFLYFDNFIETENLKVLMRTKNRLLMKRFVFDVHEVWLSNLQHLREHQPG